MKPIIRNLLIAGTLGIIAFGLMASDKIDQLTAIFGQMTIKPNSLPKNIRFSNPNVLGIPKTLSFDIDIILKNPTAEDFAVSGYVATLTNVNVYFKGKMLGNAAVNIDEVSVPSNDTMILHDINIKVEALDILQNATAFQNINVNDLTFTGTIDVLGIAYEVGQ